MNPPSRADFGGSQRPPGHYGRFGALCGFLTCRLARDRRSGSRISALELLGPPPCSFGWLQPGSDRTTLMMLDVHNNVDTVRSQSFLYDDAWFVVQSDDVRSEQFEQLRQKTERDHAAAAPEAARRTTTRSAVLTRADKEW